MNPISKETRKEACKKRPITRQGAILEVLKYKPMTARQIAEAMGYEDMNCVRPRLTELEKKGLVKIVGKRVEPTGRKGVVYAINQEI